MYYTPEEIDLIQYGMSHFEQNGTSDKKGASRGRTVDYVVGMV